jgi:phosphate transport system protein
MDSNKLGQHISSRFNDELQHIRSQVVAMGKLVEQQVELAVQAFVHGDAKLAERVIQQEKHVDDFETAIDASCTQVHALRQPTAFDLRLLITVIKTVTELEQIGDLAVDITSAAIRITDIEKKHFAHREAQYLSDLVQNMLHGALDAFERMDFDGIAGIIDQKDSIEHVHLSILQQLVAQMMADPRNIKRMLEVMATVRAIENIGEHASSICRYVIYLVSGKDIRHLNPDEVARKLQE